MKIYLITVYSAVGLAQGQLERLLERITRTLQMAECRDAAVRDAAVSADLIRRQVQVQVVAEVDTVGLAADLAYDRVQEVVDAALGRKGVVVREYYCELVDY